MARDFVLGLVKVDDTVKVKTVANERLVDYDYAFLLLTSLEFCTRGRSENGERMGGIYGNLLFLKIL